MSGVGCGGGVVLVFLVDDLRNVILRQMDTEQKGPIASVRLFWDCANVCPPGFLGEKLGEECRKNRCRVTCILRQPHIRVIYMLEQNNIHAGTE